MPMSISFPDMFDVSAGKCKIVTGDTANRQQLKSVLLTNLGELLGDPLFGSNLKSCLFEIKSPLFQRMLQESIAKAANTFVPGIRISSTEINTEESNTTVTTITVNYYTLASGETGIISLAVNSDGSLTTY